jgi:hypothetical protein
MRGDPSVLPAAGVGGYPDVRVEGVPNGLAAVPGDPLEIDRSPAVGVEGAKLFVPSSQELTFGFLVFG